MSTTRAQNSVMGTSVAGSVDFSDADIVNRVCQLVMSGVRQEDIGRIFGVTQERISQLLQMPTFVAILEAKKAELGLKYEETNDDWDSVEKLAIQTVKKKLNQPIVDADYALRAALTANRAVRRGQSASGNDPLVVPPQGRVVINLQQTFINKLTQVAHANSEATQKMMPTDGNMKVIDVANPSDVEKLLGKTDDAQFGLEKIEKLDNSAS